MLRGIGGVSASLSGDNQYTADTLGGIQDETGKLGMRIRGYFNLSISGSWNGKLTIQRSRDSGQSWQTISQYAKNEETYDEEIQSGVLYRIGFQTGDYINGTANVSISK